MKERRFVLGALVACLVVAAASLAGLAAAKPGKKAARRSRSPGSIRARTTTAAGRRRTTPGRLYVAEGARRQGPDDLQGERLLERVGPADRRRPRSRRLQDDLRHLVRDVRARRQRPALREVPEGALRAGDRARRSRRTSRSTSVPARTRSTSPAWPQAPPSKKGVIGYVVPFGIPEVVRHINAFTLGAQATHPGAKVKIVWTNAWYSPPKETAAAKALVAAGRRRARPERRQPRRRGLRREARASRGSATTPTRRSSRRSSG